MRWRRPSLRFSSSASRSCNILEKLDDQNRLARLGVEFEQIARGLKLTLAAGLVEQQTVNVFNRRRLQIEQFDRRLHRLGHGRKEQQSHAALLRQRDDFQFGGNDRRQRAFAAGEDMSQIARLAHRPGQRVAGPAFQQTRRKALGNLQRVQRSQAFQQVALSRQRVVAGADFHHAPVAGYNFQHADVIRRRAINRRVRAGRIVGNHAAQRRARTGRHVRAETESVRMQKIVQLIQHHARADADGAAFQVQVVDVPVVAREINDQAVADGSARKARARAARNDRHARLRRRLDDGAGLVRAAGKRHGQRLDLVNRRVRGVELARQIVKGDFANRRLQRGQLLIWCHG